MYNHCTQKYLEFYSHCCVCMEAAKNNSSLINQCGGTALSGILSRNPQVFIKRETRVRGGVVVLCCLPSMCVHAASSTTSDGNFPAPIWEIHNLAACFEYKKQYTHERRSSHNSSDSGAAEAAMMVARIKVCWCAAKHNHHSSFDAGLGAERKRRRRDVLILGAMMR
jgi:hypothetical protein